MAATGETPQQQPLADPRPPLHWWPVMKGAMAGWLLAAASLALLTILLTWLGLNLFDGPREEQLPYIPSNVAAVAADIALWFVVASWVSLLVADFASSWSGRPVSFALVFASVAVFGTLPFLSASSLARSSALAGLVLTVVTIRFFGTTDGERGGVARSVRLSNGLLKALLIAMGVCLAYVFGYAMTHSIWLNQHTSSARTLNGPTRYADSSDNDSRLTLRLTGDQTVLLETQMANQGPLNASVDRLVGVVSDPPGAVRLTGYRVGASIDGSAAKLSSPAKPLHLKLDGHGEQQLVLGLAVGCSSSSKERIDVDSLVVDYATLGRNWSETIPLGTKLIAVCDQRR